MSTKPIRAGLTIAVFLSGSAALAQSNGNEVWIGQTGNTNTILVIQQGNDNAAGADNVELRIDQDGSENSLTIDQFGWSNEIGSFVYDPARPVGVNQIGDRNTAELRQRNTQIDGTGSNTIAAVFQRSFLSLTNLANTLFVQQSDDAGTDGTAGHFIGTIQQENNLAESVANAITIFQSGGGNTLGNVVDRIEQIGYANILEIFQAGQDGLINIFQQFGQANFAKFEQGGGEANLIDLAQQFGNLNNATVRQEGSRNVLEQMLQNNENLGLGGVGNRIEMVVSGEDNGGDGLGAVGEFLAPETLAVSGPAQGGLSQIGDDNDIRLTIVQGRLTRFGISQIGDGNGAIVAVSAIPGATSDRNEAAIFQDGIDNNLTLSVVGNGNVLAGTQVGENNRASAFQTGDDNRIVLAFAGDNNNALAAGGFSGTAGLVATDGIFAPGDLVQTGLSNSATSTIEGSGNLVGVAQSGDGHSVESVMLGSSNQLAVYQTTADNVSLSQQTGSGNVLGVRQN